MELPDSRLKVTLNISLILLIRIPLLSLMIVRFDRSEVFTRVFVAHPIRFPNEVGDVDVLAVWKRPVVKWRNVNIGEAILPLLQFKSWLLDSVGLRVHHFGVQL